MGTKMKGLLKGLRYISQIFDEEKEPEMQIGFPTDVKHVAHVGWDGPSVHSPSWMSKFRATPEFSSAPLGLGLGQGGDHHAQENNNEVKWISEDSGRRGTRAVDSPMRDLPELPRSSRRQSPAESPVREKSDKSKTSRRQHHSEGGSSHSKKDPSRQLQDPSLLPSAGSESPSNSLPAIPKKSRRKKSKDSSVGGGSTRSSRSKANNANNNNNNSNNNGNNASSAYESPFSDPGPGTGSNFTNNEHYKTSTLQAYEEREEKLGVTRIS